MTFEQSQAIRSALDVLAGTIMDEIYDRCGFKPLSLDEFIVEYELSPHDQRVCTQLLAAYEALPY